ncbi:AraC family transcriptional regulator [Enterococcus casseliflavus]|uniref:AraC family transcriptional regulator n=1 Tax=Enterococcus casseliflavus TaxID=37734 RepID=A0A415EPI4_ENTCA|nr:AraC family transcriptional regulator [Enterococcus casseliflavus]
MKKSLYNHLAFLPNLDTSVRFFSAHTQKVPYGWTSYLDSHNAFEILLILSGKQKTTINQKEYLLDAGDILIIPPGMLHLNACYSENGLRYFTAHFDIDEPVLRYVLMKNIPLIFEKHTAENTTLQVIINEWIDLYDKAPSFSLSDKILTIQILTKLIFELIRFTELDPKKNANIQTLSIARSIAEVINHNFHHFFERKNTEKIDILIKKIYAEANVSPSYGLEAFKKIYGISPKNYLDSLKLKEAKRLLTIPDITIESISERLGYSHPAHFSRQFKNWVGISPNSYRKTNIANFVS